MGTSDILLGYDARKVWSGAESAWSEERRRRFLLRQDIEKPLSVDADVWPSVFDLSLGLTRPDWTGYVQDLWDDLQSLAAALESVALPGPTQFIAVELVAAACSTTEISRWRERVPAVVPAHLDSVPHSLAGYDVADFYLLSGLANCETAVPPDPARWAPLLNEHHLFREPASAMEFKAEVDEKVREHAPFFVFALWLLEPPPTVVVASRFSVG